ncbi:MAG: hypothetical protein CND26_03170 [Bacteroidetes bacterium MED-G13]|nr:MAG: hypothetical protein CND26_03170 [Bacteroidetes bacterium MED-G13]
MTKNKISDHQEEIDVFRLLKKTSQFTTKIIKRSIDFFVEIFSKWKILLPIIFISFVLGLLYENKNMYSPDKEGSLLVRLNHGSSIYFYNSVDLLKQKIVSGDTNFFNETLQFEEGEELLDISLTPIISSNDFFALFDDHNQMKVLINNTENLDETIKYNIKQHKISFLLSSGSSTATVDKIMRYLSSNPIYESISNIYVQETLNKIEESNQTIRQINKLVEKYSAQNSEKGRNSQVYVDGQTENVSDILNIKLRLIDNITESKTDLIVEATSIFRYDEEVALIPKKKTFGKKTVLFPVITIFSFIILFLVRKSFLNYRKIV